MSRRRSIHLLVMTLVTVIVLASSLHTAAQGAALVALNEAVRVPEIQQRANALRKVIDDYPNTEVAATAESELLSMLIVGAGIVDDASVTTFVEKELTRTRKLNELYKFVSGMAQRGEHLEQAEKVAKMALAIDEKTAIAALRDDQAAAVKSSIRRDRDGVFVQLAPDARPPRRTTPDEDFFRDRVQSLRLDLVASLGQIYLKQGRTAEASKVLADAYAQDIPNGTRRALALALAQVAAKAGDTQQELSYRATVQVLGGGTPAGRDALLTLYGKTHGGSLDGLDAFLDEQYRKYQPKPIEAKAYKRSKTETPRLALVELFTGSNCPPCVAADMALDAVLERFSRDEVAVLVYHQHIPGPDALTNASTDGRRAIYSVRGVPTFAVDGRATVGGGGAAQAKDIFEKFFNDRIEKELSTPPDARLELKATLTGSRISVTADVSRIASTSPGLRLQIALVEELQRYSGSNGVRFHPMVVRKLAGTDMKGFRIEAAKGASIEHTFDVRAIQAENAEWIDGFLGRPFRGGDKPSFSDGRRDAIDMNKLIVVAFVQDEDALQRQEGDNGSGQFTRKVLQAASVRPAAQKITTH